MDKYEIGYSNMLENMNKMRSRLHRPSKEYKAVYESLREIVAMQEQNISPISPLMLGAQENLNKACETYMQSHAGERKTDRGKERFDMVSNLNGINNNRYEETSKKAEEVYGRDLHAWSKIAPLQIPEKPSSEKKGVNFAHALEVDVNTGSVKSALEDDPQFKQIVEKSKGLKSTDFKSKTPDWNKVMSDTSNEYRAKYEDMRKAAPKNPSENYKDVMKSLAQMVYTTKSSSDIKSPEVKDAHAKLTRACVRYGVDNDMNLTGDGKKIAGLVDDVKNINKDFKNAMEGKLPEKKTAGKKEIPMSKLADKKAQAERKKSDAKKQEPKKKAEKKQEPKKKEEKKAAGMGK